MVRVATSPSTASFQWRYFDGSVWKSIRLLPLLSLRSASAMDVLIPSFSGNVAFAVIAKEAVGETGDGGERRLRRLAVRRMPRVRQQRDLDRAVALLLRGLDLTHGAVLVVLALHDQHRHPDMGQRVGDVPLAELGI